MITLPFVYIYNLHYYFFSSKIKQNGHGNMKLNKMVKLYFI